MSIKLSLPFTLEDCERAYAAWGCNCGPAALAAVFQMDLEDVRPFLGEFEQRGYTSPSMMRDAVLCIARDRGAKVTCQPGPLRGRTLSDAWPDNGLIRFQWTGPWTAPEANPRWAYRHTHWIAAFRRCDRLYTFDVNSGLQTLLAWEVSTAPAITKSIPLADGGYFATHVWTIGGKA